MNPLPSLEMLAFLDWMDKNGIFQNIHDETIEEFLFNHHNDNDLRNYVSEFLATKKQYDKGNFESKLDYIFAYIKAEAMKSAVSEFYGSYSFHYNKKIVEVVCECAQRAKNDVQLIEELETIPYDVYNEDYMIDSLRIYLNYADTDSKYDHAIDFFKSSKGTSANAVCEFLSWLDKQHIIRGKISAIPYAILNKRINDFEMDYYKRNYSLSREEVNATAMAVRRAFQNSENIPYFDKLTKRYRYRTAIYKCVFLSEDNQFYELIEQHWSELNQYTGNYLDIFYNPDELKSFQGYSIADGLQIRNRISSFPNIYIWKTTLHEGIDIPVIGLKIEGLLVLIKGLVDLIVEQKSFDEIIDSGRKLSELLRLQITRRQVIEDNVLMNLYYACITLQNNPVTFGNVDENQKNTQIRDLMRSYYKSTHEIAGVSYQIAIDDQTFHGLSATGKSFGQLDLLVKLDALPFCIIEGIDVKTEKQGIQWSRTKLFEHIRRFGNYDQNGLERNILLVYVNTDCFDIFYQSLLTAIKNNPSKAYIRQSKIDNIIEIPTDPNNASLRIMKGRYLYNNRERSLYIFVVQISQIVS